MNFEEVGMIMNLIAAEYPTFLANVDDETAETVMDIWTEALEPYEFEAIKKSFIRYIQTSEYPPKVASLIKGVEYKDPTYNIPDVAATKEIMKRYDPAPEEERLTTEQIHALVYEKLGWRLKK